MLQQFPYLWRYRRVKDGSNWTLIPVLNTLSVLYFISRKQKKSELDRDKHVALRQNTDMYDTLHRYGRKLVLYRKRACGVG